MSFLNLGGKIEKINANNPVPKLAPEITRVDNPSPSQRGVGTGFPSSLINVEVLARVPGSGSTLLDLEAGRELGTEPEGSGTERLSFSMEGRAVVELEGRRFDKSERFFELPQPRKEETGFSEGLRVAFRRLAA